MLKLQMSDVLATLSTLIPYGAAIVVFAILSVAVIVLTGKKRVANVAMRKIIHSQVWIVLALAAIVSVLLMMYGPLATILTNATEPKYTLSDSAKGNAEGLASQIQSESVTLLENKSHTLPLSSKKINIFGWASTNLVYGGTGSGSLNDQYPTVSLLDGLKDGGFTANRGLSKLYTDYRSDRPKVGLGAKANDWTLPEVPASQYPSSLIQSARKFSNTAVVVLSRIGGEGADIPTDMTQKSKDFIYKDNGDYADFQQGQNYLELTRTEKDMLTLVTKNFQKVTLIYNGSNTLQFDFLEQYPQITSVVWCPPAGQTGFDALGKILGGKTNPSGKTTDTFLKNLQDSPSTKNYSDFEYVNAEDVASSYTDKNPGEKLGKKVSITPTFMNYVEGIYVGYKFYETAADDGLINYADKVQFPFGYGLSYTKFEQKMGGLTHANGKVSLDVRVTNTGEVAGKDVVELYYDPPYVNGGIEKVSVNLIAFRKTKELKPGASQTISIVFNEGDMASYDSLKSKAWVLDKGDYGISLRSDSHTTIDKKTMGIDQKVVYNTNGNTHNGDKVPATNQFDDAEGNVTYLSRSNHFANYAQATAAPTNFDMSDAVKAQFSESTDYKPVNHNNDSDKMPITGAKNGVRLAQLTGKQYGDPLWTQLLDQLTFKEMDSLVSTAAYGSAAIDDIGKIRLIDNDGPAALTNNYTGSGSIGFPSAIALAATWNKDLAKRYGQSMGAMARELNVSGWYAPAMNIHRTQFGGRNFEYYSEDGLLSGVMASNAVAGAKTKGVYAVIKHLALNDQGLNQSSTLCVWASEQSMREIYFRPFEMSVKNGHAAAAMSAFNYVGPRWAGANSALLKKVLRGEWGFHGFVVTDMFAGKTSAYMSGDKGIRNGNDAMLAPFDSTNHITDKSATSMKALRTASHNILYTAANSWRYQHGDPTKEIAVWRIWTWTGVGIALVMLVGFEALSILRFIKRRKR